MTPCTFTHFVLSGNCRVRFRRGCQTGNFLSQCMAEIPSLKGLKYEKILVIEISW